MSKISFCSLFETDLCGKYCVIKDCEMFHLNNEEKERFKRWKEDIVRSENE